MTSQPPIASFTRSDADRLVALLRRLLRWDSQAYVRIVSREDAIGIYFEPPFKVIAYLLVPAIYVVPMVDSTMRAADLLAAIDNDEDITSVPLQSDFEPFGVGVRPPEEPWQTGDKGIAGDLIPKVQAAINEFKERMEAVGPKPTRRMTEEIANEIWDRPGWGGLTLRVLHAAYLLGFLSHPNAHLATGNCLGWKRLQTPGGTLYARPGDSGPRLPLSIVR